MTNDFATLPTNEATARMLDEGDPLRAFRDLYEFPRLPGGPDSSRALYFVGNSLGLMARPVRDAVIAELDDWARLGVEAHFDGRHPWMPYHEELRAPLARVVGAMPHEVVAMNSLTVNLHLLMVSFYRPTRERFKIIIEDTAFPSDSYAVQSQLQFHAERTGFDPKAGLIRLKPREGEHALRTEDICDTIERHESSTALVMLGGVNYLTGQFFDIPAITAFARQRGITVGWDLAHAAGNIDVRLHDWGPDFACWCSYKYLNAGPGAVAGAFVHDRWLTADRSKQLPRFEGWWGTDPATRFKMGPDFQPVASADAWQLSNPPILAMAPLRASLELFDRATMPALRAKSLRLVEFMAQMLARLNADAQKAGKHGISVLTPTDPNARGCQWSLVLPGDARAMHTRLGELGVMTDFREPNVIRVAPVPLYNSFHDVWRLAEALRTSLGLSSLSEPRP
jgi:kynureninase